MISTTLRTAGKLSITTQPEFCNFIKSKYKISSKRGKPPAHGANPSTQRAGPTPTSQAPGTRG